MMSAAATFDRDLHVSYMQLMLQGMPSFAQSEDSIRLTLAYFLISGLDVLDALAQVDTDQVIDWVYGVQVLPVAEGEEGMAAPRGCFYGFRGSPSIGTRFSPFGAPPLLFDAGHLASTYSALAILRILGDDFSRLQRELLLTSLQRLQQADGSFTAIHTGGETDLRFVFCAVAISAMLNDWTGLDSQKALEFILECQSYDEGFGLSPGLESHGGATYCAVCALKLMGHIVPSPISGVMTSEVVNVNGLIKWCVQKQSQSGGFQGRCNKEPDTCYAFWVGGVLSLLRVGHLCNTEALRASLLSCQSKYGGFSKWPGKMPDVLHAYYGVCGMSLLGEPGLQSICPEQGITSAALHSSRGLDKVHKG